MSKTITVSLCVKTPEKWDEATDEQKQDWLEYVFDSGCLDPENPLYDAILELDDTWGAVDYDK